MGRTTVDTFDPVPGSEDTVAAEPTPRPSNRIALDHGAHVGRYLILSVIGRGGMGIVYAAHDPQLDRQVALKLIRTADSPEEAARLVREAQALAKLADPHVVAVYDAGEVDGQVFVAMQLVDGEDLAAALQKRRRSEDVSQVLSWFRDAGLGLAAAHAARLVHRDFKPSNVLIDKNGRVAVTDFGIAREQGRTHDPERRALSSANKLIGTPAYMAPEQHALERATEASDQFAFCVSLWEALFECHPFVADRTAVSSVEIGIAIFEGKILPPRRRGRVPRRIVDAIARGLSRDPGARWPSMMALLAELEPSARRRRWPVPVVAVAAGVVAIGVAGVAVWRLHESAPHDRSVASCDLATGVDSAWPANREVILRKLVAASGAGYAGRVAQTLGARLDRAASRLRGEATEACAAQELGDGPGIAARVQCVVERTAELDGFAGELADAGSATPDFVLDAEQLLAPVLPCGTGRAGETAVPIGRARSIARDVGAGLGLFANGRGSDAEALLEQAADHAEGGRDHALEAQARYLRGAIETDRDEPSSTDLERAIGLASLHGVDDVAARAWFVRASTAAPADATTAWFAANAAAERTGDQELEALAQVGEALAMVRWDSSSLTVQTCKSYETAIAASEQVRHLARTCLMVSDHADVQVEFDADSQALAKIYGAGHPALADALASRGWAVVTAAQTATGLDTSRLEAAGADLAQALGLYEQRYPAHHEKLARVHHQLGWLAYLEHRTDDARAELAAAIDAIAARRAAHARLAALIYRDFALISHGRGALDAIRIAMSLDDHLDILAIYATVAADNAEWDEAAMAAERVLLARPLPVVNAGYASWARARVLVATHRDTTEAHRLATEARAAIARGQDTATLAAIDAWLAKH